MNLYIKNKAEPNGSEDFAAFKNEICSKATTRVLQDQFVLKNTNIVAFKYSNIQGPDVED